MSLVRDGQLSLDKSYEAETNYPRQSRPRLEVGAVPHWDPIYRACVHVWTG